MLLYKAKHVAGPDVSLMTEWTRCPRVPPSRGGGGLVPHFVRYVQWQFVRTVL